MADDTQKDSSEQILVRVGTTTREALMLAVVFERKRSMQQLVAGLLQDYVTDLAAKDPGFAKALAGLAESSAQRDGVLARRRAGRPDASSGA